MSEIVKCSECFQIVLSNISSKIKSDITLKDFLELVGDRGRLILCMILATPFLIPVSIPGSSIPLGLTILFIGISMVINRFLIPDRILNYKLSKNSLIMILKGSTSVLNRLEKFIKPRILILTNNPIINRVNGILLVFSAILLILPLPIPLTDSLPAYGIFFLATGSLECDGYLILAGYLIVILTTIYFGLVILLGWEGISAILSYFGFNWPKIT